MISACPKCYTEGKHQEMEPHLYTFHLHCPKHGWLAKSDVVEYWDAINEFKSKGSKPSGVPALQVANEAC